jgi:hypothetical protein
MILDGGVVAASVDPSRRYQLDKIGLSFGGMSVRHASVGPGVSSTASRAHRKLLHTSCAVSRSKGYHWSSSLGHSLLDPWIAARVRMLDGHYECAELPLAAASAGLARTVTPSQPTEAAIQLLRDIRPTDLAVHVRLGDFRTHADGAFLLSRDYYRSAITLATSAHGTTRVRVFSDEPDSAVEFLTPILPREHQLVLSKGLSTADDFVAMSKHAAIVSSRSSYSWWASFLSSASVVVGPHGTDRFEVMSSKEGWLLV